VRSVGRLGTHRSSSSSSTGEPADAAAHACRRTTAMLVMPAMCSSEEAAAQHEHSALSQKALLVLLSTNDDASPLLAVVPDLWRTPPVAATWRTWAWARSWRRTARTARVRARRGVRARTAAAEEEEEAPRTRGARRGVHALPARAATASRLQALRCDSSCWRGAERQAAGVRARERLVLRVRLRSSSPDGCRFR
jgi:hypothetical protein